MTKRERVLAALRGEQVDRVPVSAWRHDFLREWTPEGLAQATIDAYRKFDWDFVKVNPRASYYAEDWGSRYQPSGRADQSPQLIEPAVKSAADLARVRALDVSRGAYGEQLAALGIIAGELAGEAPVVQTVFSPLAVMSRLTGSTEAVQGLMREAPRQFEAALIIVAETLADYARACLDRGAAGIFFATVEWGSRDSISAADYERFGRPFDLQVLAVIPRAGFNVLHVCRDNNLLEHLLDYPVAAFHWDVRARANPRLADILARSNKAVMGGVARETIMAPGSPEAVAAEARAAIAETGGRRFLLAPGCSVDPQAPAANLHALREAAGP
ncbi:MAG: uroporphyrinogen decarboxylase family protein [Dehalococcoidia bacterium]